MSDAEHPRGQVYPIRGGKNGPPPPEGAPRRLAAIVAGDIAGYSRLIEMDEEGTLGRVKRQRREIIEPTISEHHGRLVKYTGDGFLAMFDSPVEAVRSAIVIQQTMVGRNASLPRERWILYRIGVHLGDVIVESDDIYGEGVNIAARLEGIARPGDVFISGGVYEQIKNKLVCAYQALGDRQVKNITDPISVYRVLPDPSALISARKARRSVVIISLSLLMIGALGSALAIYIWIRQQVLVTHQGPPAIEAPRTALSTPPAAPVLPPTPPTTSAQPSPSAIPVSPPASPSVSPVAPAPSVTNAPPAQASAVPIAPPGVPTLPAMVSIPGGTFAMGSNDDLSEKPIHRVTIKPFAISKFPITVREWNECVAAKACSYVVTGKDDAPATNLSWDDAQEFVSWLTRTTQRKFRLPTEAEWEYAARAGTQTKFWWGDQFQPSMANCRGCGTAYDPAQPLNVGSFKPNPFGLHDMGGSVDQWVEDCWHKDYQGAPIDGSAWIDRNCSSRVIRSGSWKSDTNYMRPANRDRYDTGVRYPTHGFRIAAWP